MKILNYFIYLSMFFCIEVSESEMLTFDSKAEWEDWKLPRGLVEIDEGGYLRLSKFRKNINAIREAGSFEHNTSQSGMVRGGIWRVGSGGSSASMVIDGKLETFWKPDPDDPLAKWEIEIDLGRPVLARQIHLYFPDIEGARPPTQFSVYLATGGSIDTQKDIFYFEPVYQTTLPNKNTEVVVDLSGRRDTARVVDSNVKVDNLLESGFRTVQFIRISIDEKIKDVSLSEIYVDAVGDNIALGLAERGGTISAGIVVRDAYGMVDGDMNTYASKFTTYRATGGWRDEGLWWEMDLGAQFWLDEIFIYFLNPGEGASGSSVKNAGTGFSFLHSDGRRTTSGDVDYDRLIVQGREDGTEWIDKRHFRYFFSPKKIRYLFWHGHLTALEWFVRVPELMLFSAGYPAQVVLRSEFIDLGVVAGDQRAKAIKALHWDASFPVDTELRLRSRSGMSLDENYMFYNKIGEQVTEARFNSMPAVLRGKVDTTVVAGSDWSGWSNFYQKTGESFKSESPRRYIQLEAILATEDPENTPVLKSLGIEFEDALVQDARGIIVPRQTRPNEETNFMYGLRSEADKEHSGYDTIRFFWPGSIINEGTIKVYIADSEIDVEVSVRSDSITVKLPEVVSSDSLIFSFSARVLQNAASCEVDISNSQNVGLWQNVEPAERRASQVFLPELVGGHRLLHDIRFSSDILTPNNDGVNDELVVEFVVYKTEFAKAYVRIYDLSGRMIATLSKDKESFGNIYTWDARDSYDKFVPPGIYTLQIKLDAQVGSESVSRKLSVAY